MNKQLIIIVDADVLIAQTDPYDAHHKKTTQIAEKLISQNARVLYPITAIAEANAHIQRVLNNTAHAYNNAQLMAGADAQVVEVGKQTLINSLRYFSPKTSKKNTLFDCIIAALAQEYKADAIFSFDTFYKQHGFTLASEL